VFTRNTDLFGEARRTNFSWNRHALSLRFNLAVRTRPFAVSVRRFNPIRSCRMRVERVRKCRLGVFESAGSNQHLSSGCLTPCGALVLQGQLGPAARKRPCRGSDRPTSAAATLQVADGCVPVVLGGRAHTRHHLSARWMVDEHV